MTTNLNHRDWIAQQFKGTYLRKWYRNVLIHSSIIEGILVKESGMDTFDTANKCLLKCGKIVQKEYVSFDNVRKLRNKLAHGIFSKGGLDQPEIDKLRDDLMENIYNAYRISPFLENKIFLPYKIVRKSIISYNP